MDDAGAHARCGATSSASSTSSTICCRNSPRWRTWCCRRSSRGLSQAEARERAAQLLAFLGLGERLAHRPGELSGGEQQRVAIARAVANAPRILLADEPTGNLDPHTAGHVFQTLLAIVRASRLAALVATHNMDLAAKMDRRVTIREGLVVQLA